MSSREYDDNGGGGGVAMMENLQQLKSFQLQIPSIVFSNHTLLIVSIFPSVILRTVMYMDGTKKFHRRKDYVKRPIFFTTLAPLPPPPPKKKRRKTFPSPPGGILLRPKFKYF